MQLPRMQQLLGRSVARTICLKGILEEFTLGIMPAASKKWEHDGRYLDYSNLSEVYNNPVYMATYSTKIGLQTNKLKSSRSMAAQWPGWILFATLQRTRPSFSHLPKVSSPHHGSTNAILNQSDPRDPESYGRCSISGIGAPHFQTDPNPSILRQRLCCRRRQLGSTGSPLPGIQTSAEVVQSF